MIPDHLDHRHDHCQLDHLDHRHDHCQLGHLDPHQVRDDQWLGVAVSSQGPGGKAIVCAHRYTRYIFYQDQKNLHNTETILVMIFIPPSSGLDVNFSFLFLFELLSNFYLISFSLLQSPSPALMPSITHPPDEEVTDKAASTGGARANASP